MNSGQQLSRILFLPDKLKIITRWLSQYVTLLLCHMALDTETQHNLIKWHPNWRSGTLERAGFPFERTSTNQRSKLEKPHEVEQSQMKLCTGVRSAPCARPGWGLNKQPHSWTLGLTQQQLLTAGENPGKGCWDNKGATAQEVQREGEATALLRLETRSPR